MKQVYHPLSEPNGTQHQAWGVSCRVKLVHCRDVLCSLASPKACCSRYSDLDCRSNLTKLQSLTQEPIVLWPLLEQGVAEFLVSLKSILI